MSGYANNDVLVTTEWVNQNLKTPGVRVVEVDVDPKLYAAGHVPGAVGWDWNKDLQDPVRRDIPSAAQVSGLLSRAGIRPTDTVVLYGDSSNWFAAYGFWVLKLYGHKDVRLMNGGRVKWLNESDKPMVTEVPRHEASAYAVSGIDESHRARLTDVLAVATGQQRVTLVDVRSPDEYSGKVIAPPGMTETAQRGGHIPGALSVPWASAVNQDGTFKSAQELRALYLADKGVSVERPVIAYCRIGERSSHTWFVLKYLLGLPQVKNYDGSWTEYGSVIGVPIEK
ncbi:MAG: sulfurtransferase [Planctomyces sp.]|nr:sulfurtransferase [Planctomyces sp.]